MTIAQTEAPNAVQPKYQTVADELRRRIGLGDYSVGAKLPSVLELSQEFSVSAATAAKAVRELAKERLVTSRANRRGTTVLRQEAPGLATRRKLLGCLLRPFRPRNEIDNFGVEVVQGIQDEISARGYRFVYHNVYEEDNEARVRELVDEHMIAGIILDQLTPAATVERLAASGLPTLLFNRLQVAENLSVVLADYERAGRRTFEELLRRGYRRFAFAGPPQADFTRPEFFSHHNALCAGFQAQARTRGLSDRVGAIPDVVPKDPVANQPEQFGLPRRKGADWEPLGIGMSTDTRARQLMDVIAKTDLVPGRDIGLIGQGDMECNRLRAPSFSTWRIDRHALGVATVDELIARIEDPDRPASIVKMPLEFVDRGTA